MYIGDKLMDQTILSFRAMQDQRLREAYVQGAIAEMLEKWDDQIKEQDLKPRFISKVRVWKLKIHNPELSDGSSYYNS
jgi:hypothetical protein